MDNLPQLDQSVDLVQKFVETHILTTASVVQMGWFIAALAISFLIAKRAQKPFSRAFEGFKHSSWKTLYRAIEAILVPLFLMVLLLPLPLIADMQELDSRATSVVLNLLGAWVIIRFLSAFIEYTGLARALAIFIWCIAALRSVDLLEPFINQLDGFGFMLGETRISPLTILKGLLTFGVMLWFAGLLARISERQISQISQITPSLRVLIGKIIRTFLIIFAVIIGLNTLGIDLTSLAVFSGAIGVGIGFGLQKVVSNFVSGIILLIDRSIKPGDVIAIDQTYGWVNKLSARHASVITRDGKEHLIPNELLITERVENWSYSDKNVRLKIPVGVSYNCNPHECLKLLLEAADETPRILSYPKPNALVMGFGDSSVDLELRAWINDPANGVSNITSELLLNIWDKFQEHNVEIPFPQRDVHIKSGSS
ncbi:MAG: mechanosensitive ion channel [Rickettsiales bacterium]|nr:mechanosensitive ion channel [Rickettsiales bacterium]